MKNKKSRKGDVEVLFLFVLVVSVFIFFSGSDDENKTDTNNTELVKNELEFTEENFKKLQEDIKIHEKAYTNLYAEKEEEKRQTASCQVELREAKLVNILPTDDYSTNTIEDATVAETNFGTGY